MFLGIEYWDGCYVVAYILKLIVLPNIICRTLFFMFSLLPKRMSLSLVALLNHSNQATIINYKLQVYFLKNILIRYLYEKRPPTLVM